MEIFLPVKTCWKRCRSWCPALGSVSLPIPFYFMELLVGFVQALVFMLLTAVFTMLICQHDEGARSSAHH